MSQTTNNNKNSRKTYTNWTTDFPIDPITGEKGQCSKELLFEWLSVPENFSRWNSKSKKSETNHSVSESKCTVIKDIVQYMKDRGIHHRTVPNINTRLSQMKQRYKTAVEWLRSNSQGIMERTFIADDPEANKKAQEEAIRAGLLKMCPEYDQIAAVWIGDVLAEPTCQSGENNPAVIMRVNLSSNSSGNSSGNSSVIEKVIQDPIAPVNNRKRKASTVDPTRDLIIQQNELEDKRLAIEKERLAIEREKLQIERKKLKLLEEDFKFQRNIEERRIKLMEREAEARSKKAAVSEKRLESSQKHVKVEGYRMLYEAEIINQDVYRTLVRELYDL
ncbi:hypothetical protein EDC96DRAFT_610045 [Choanephora cucurbitarum]|nr:hypothetical protein EDC96DRAFT_610045 [Choanephora cucurbitarum]